MRNKNISVVVPAYNEQKRIGSTLQKMHEYLSRHFNKYEIIVVDDGSTDSTREVLKRRQHKCMRVISYKPNRGKGYAVRTGMLVASYDFVLFSDADLSTPIEELGKFMKEIGSYDFLIASRNADGSHRVENQSVLRRIAGRVFGFVIKMLLFGSVSDTQCGFKLFKKNTIEPLFGRQTLDGFSFDVELICIARKLGLLFKEIPVDWYDNTDSKVRAFSDSLRMFREVLKIKQNALGGVYD